ncbi:carbohydrate ABC transporter permease [Paenibacillus aquistagni]|uniref:Carbohydrate ABC transporter membrane protein 1, CUT1 family n=1 Tax=Paenibacillus aquistagni TaxID=1852522 RepID=A0A1X7KLK4_9BACL|nr:sugar ABC transporter permease [Paenibacillus aquistagni]SMG42029.1 carbohydrate ABC transporter membrane protein 1, CUT1 family [Paenibacillus aquistagni]
MRRIPWQPYLYLSPVLVLYAIFFVFPLFFSLYISFMEWDLLLDKKQFVGLSNYQEVLSNPLFWKVIRNTLLYMALTVPPSAALGLVYALAIERAGKLRSMYRVLFFVPVVISVSVAGLVFSLMFSPQKGLFNEWLGLFGIGEQAWLQDTKLAMFALAIVGVWMSFGYNVVLYISGLKQLNNEVKEAAAIDGASGWQSFRHMTFPLLMPVHMFVWTITLLHSLQIFATVHIMTLGGPNNSTNVWAFFIWQEAFQFFNTGTASAAATILFVIVLGLTVIQVRWMQKRTQWV